jgi:hypothetical protein
MKPKVSEFLRVMGLDEIKQATNTRKYALPQV